MHAKLSMVMVNKNMELTLCILTMQAFVKLKEIMCHLQARMFAVYI